MPHAKALRRKGEMSMSENEIAKQIVDAAFKVHTTLGPGLLESVYEVVLAYEAQASSCKTNTYTDSLRRHQV
jgi:hypothetical protein